MSFKFLGTAMAVALFTFGISAVQAAEDKDVIDYRQNLMKSLGAHAAGLGAIAQNKVPYGENLAHHADAIAAAAEAAQLAFAQNLPGGTAAANIWEEWDDFQARFAGLAESAREVAAAARSGGMAEAGPKMGEMFVCKSCHDKYRTE